MIELFETALNDRTKEWRIKVFYGHGQGGDSGDEIDLRTIHEAYQYLFLKFVDDVAKNTVSNKRATLCLSIGKFYKYMVDQIKL